MDNSADFAVTLPSAFPTPGAVLQNGIALKERRQERQDSQAERDRSFNERQSEFNQRQQISQAERAHSNRLHNLSTINQIETSKYPSSDEHVRQHVGELMNSVKETALKNADADPLEIANFIQTSMKPISDWYGAAQNDIAKNKLEAAEIQKTLPNANPLKLNAAGEQSFRDKFFQTDANGNLGARSLNSISQSGVSHFDKILQEDPMALGSIVDNKGYLDKHIQTDKMQPMQNPDETNSLGHVVYQGGKGEISKFSEPVLDKKGRIIGTKLKVENLVTGVDENGKDRVTPMIPQDLFNQLKTDKPAYGEFLNYWGQKMPGIDAEYVKNTGRPIDPVSQEKLMRSAYYHYIKDNNLDLSHWNENQPQKAAITNIRINNALPVQTEDIYKPTVQAVKDIPVGETFKINKLPFASQKFFINAANEAKHGKTISAYDYDSDNILLTKKSDGGFSIFDNKKKNTELLPLTGITEHDMNSSVAKGVKQTQEELKISKKAAANPIVQPILKDQQSNTAPQTAFSREIEDGIGAVMQKNKGVSREQVIEALKKAGKIQ